MIKMGEKKGCYKNTLRESRERLMVYLEVYTIPYSFKSSRPYNGTFVSGGAHV
jgi:hypothetical protein